jgi:radical SAM superfamily enzyme YgiQ (UPF0313 family)
MRPFAPLGPLYVAAALEAAGHEVRFFDATFERDLSGFPRALEDWRPQIAGIYSTFLSKPGALRMGDAARRRGVFAVAGGPEPCVHPEQYLDGHFDAVVAGEGEATAVELAAALEGRAGLDRTPGLILPKGGRAVATGRRELARDLDSLHFPLRRLIDMERYRRAWRARHGFFALNIMASRGCPFGCEFCSRPVFGRSHRTRSVDNVMAEIDQVVQKHRPERVRFSDDILPLDRRWTRSLCAAIQRSGLDVGFECLARTDLMDRELLNEMGRAGFRRLYYGVESGSQRVLDAMGKGTRVGDIRRIARLTREAGMEQHWFIMLGYPGESQSDVEKTLALMAEAEPDEFSTTVASPIKGTALYARTREEAPQKNACSGARRLGNAWNILRMHAQLRLARRLGPASPITRGAASLFRSVSGFLAGGAR